MELKEQNIDKSHKLEIMRHSAAHLMAAAVLKLWPDALFGVGPSIKNGYYYDFDLPVTLSSADLPKIEEKMAEIRAQHLPFEKIEMNISDAIELMMAKGQVYKVELLQILKEKGTTAVAKEVGDKRLPMEEGLKTVTLYRLGNFVDLCRGPHVKDTGEISFFKLLHISGAYWRGDEKNKQLQRIYGVAFESTKELNEHLAGLDEAKKRDHRRLGEDLKIFTFAEEVGPGLPLWLPNGTTLRLELEKLAMEEEKKDGYVRVATPHLTKDTLYYRSGHLPYYRHDMYAPIEIEGQDYFLKPMNCPHHHQIYLSEPKSYRDLPLRLAEYGWVYRFEHSGTLNGILRTRGFIQNDAHIYCRVDQVKDEFVKVMRLHARLYNLCGLTNFYMRLSLPDMYKIDKYVNEPEEWLIALKLVREAMMESGYPYIEAPGEAAFYGPKIDFQLESVLGVEYTMSTNQLDFIAAKRFNLSYKGDDGKNHPVYVIHRAPLGSHERFIAFLLEHYAGAFPVWLAPVQVTVIPIADRHIEYAKNIREVLFRAEAPTVLGGVRVELDDSRESMQKRIRNATTKKIPYMLIIGDREVEKKEVSVRTRSGVDLKGMTLDAFLERITTEIKARRDNPSTE